MKALIDQYVGKKALFEFGLAENIIKVEVTVLDLKRAYGKTLFLITPSAGSGQMWVQNVELIK